MVPPKLATPIAPGYMLSRGLPHGSEYRHKRYQVTLRPLPEVRSEVCPGAGIVYFFLAHLRLADSIAALCIKFSMFVSRNDICRACSSFVSSLVSFALNI
jgi:hypothetical protein